MSLSGANSIMTMKIARSANLTAQGVTGASSQTEAFALSDWKQSTEYYSRTVMSSFLTSRASFQEKSNSRFVLSGRTKAFVLFPCLPFSLSLSLSLSRTGRWCRCLTRSLSHSFAKGRGIVFDRDTLGTLSVYPSILGVSTPKNVLYAFIQGVPKYALKDYSERVKKNRVTHGHDFSIPVIVFFPTHRF